MENKQTLKEKLLAVQMEVGGIKKDADNPYFKSKYFDINGLLAVVKPVLNKYGLVLTQSLQYTNDKQMLVTMIMDSASADIISSECKLPEMQDPQKFGSVITYFRRYSLQSMLALEAVDDDGNSESDKEVSTPSKMDETKAIAPLLNELLACKNIQELTDFGFKMKTEAEKLSKLSKNQVTMLRKAYDNKMLTFKND